jgi:hypothetical protein
MKVEIELEIGYTIVAEGSMITLSDGKGEVSLPEDPEQREEVMEALRVAVQSVQRADNAARRLRNAAS